MIKLHDNNNRIDKNDMMLMYVKLRIITISITDTVLVISTFNMNIPVGKKIYGHQTLISIFNSIGVVNTSIMITVTIVIIIIIIFFNRFFAFFLLPLRMSKSLKTFSLSVLSAFSSLYFFLLYFFLYFSFISRSVFICCCCCCHSRGITVVEIVIIVSLRLILAAIVFFVFKVSRLLNCCCCCCCVIFITIHACCFEGFSRPSVIYFLCISIFYHFPNCLFTRRQLFFLCICASNGYSCFHSSGHL